MIGKAGTYHTQIVLWLRETMMTKRKLQDDEIVLDLANFLPGGRKFWWTSEVNSIVTALNDHMPGLIRSLEHETRTESHPHYQVLHIALSDGTSEEEFRRQVAIVMSYYKNSIRLRRAHGSKAAS